MNNLSVFEFVDTRNTAFSMSVRNDNFKAIQRINDPRLGRYLPHHAAKLSIKSKFVQGVSIQPGDHICVCRYRVFTDRDGRRKMAWAGTQIYPYSGRYARMLINAYHPGTGTRRPYLTLDGNF